MSRNDVLVDADWVAGAPGRPDGRPRRGRRGHLRLRQGPHPQRRPDRLDATTCRTRSAATSSTRSSSRRCCPRAASATTTPSCSTAATTTGSPPTPTGTSSSTATSDVKLLDGGRKKWELDCRELADERARAARPRRTPRRRRTPRSAPSATRSSPRSATQNLVDVRSPRRVLRPAARPGPPAAGAVAAGRATSRPRANIPWRKAANDDGTFKSRRRADATLYDGRGRGPGQGHHRLLPHRRALGAHLVRAARAARASRTSRTTTARGPSTARWSACRSRSAPSPGVAG